ncbi:hypothetical protein FB451DRAFT_1372108 [Mycena latifolia]|nr:hypothetical protein FB451DRAFT_1372108 [Mycena latifolia]
MHRSLQPQMLIKLPLSLRRLAVAAAAGSLDELVRLQGLMITLPEEQSHALLPVFYSNLDPANIPTIEQLDALPAIATLAVARASVSLKGIHVIGNFHLDCFTRLWSRFWPWIQFFDAYNDCLPPRPAPAPTEADICLIFLIFVRAFEDSELANDLLFATPRFRFMVARGWRILSQIQHTPHAIIGYRVVAHFLLGRMKAVSAEHLAEVLDGAGGDSSDLAALAVEFVRDLVPDRTKPVNADDILLLEKLLKFVIDVDAVIIGPSPSEVSAGELGLSLRKSVVGSITTMLYALAQNPAANSAPLLGRTLTYLHRILSTYGYPLMADALEHGILHAILLCGRTGTFHPKLVSLLDHVLPASLLHYNILDSLEYAMPAAHDLANLEAFQASSLSEPWQRFAVFAADRLEILKLFHDGVVESLKACDNLDCRFVSEKPHFRRCAGCRTSYYCSHECQATDWRAGGHREFCDRHSAFHLDENRNLNVRERSFLRDCVLTWDYEIAKHDIIYPQKVLFMAQHPSAQFFTLYDYTRGPAQISVLPVDGPFAREVFDDDPAWLRDVARAARSGGCMELEVMNLAAGHRSWYLVVALRYGTTEIHETLQRLAAESPFARDPPDLAQLIVEIRDPALKSIFSGVAIH